MDCRLIPAHAGKTELTGTSDSARGTHPRSRGENSCFGDFGCGTAGSSPLTRGKPAVFAPCLRYVGLIPTRVGKTGRGSRGPPRCQAHPRLYGENPALVTMDEIWKGSSPLTRGKRHAVRARSDPRGLIPAHAGKTYGNGHCVASHRLIPAHAGKTPGHRGRSTPERAHPRSRGENRAEKAHPAFQKGSSLLTQGKLDV